MFHRLGCIPALALVVCTIVSAEARGSFIAWRDVVRDSGSVKPDLELIRQTADSMALRSPTFAQMLTMLRSAPDVIVFVQATAVAGKLGETRFFVASGQTMMVMQLNTYRVQPTLRIRGLAHELAHAVEVACMPRQSDTRLLAKILFEHGRPYSLPQAPSAETPFPAAVENAVLHEYQRSADSTGELWNLTRQYSLPGCQ